jgi:hypothetical protein
MEGESRKQMAAVGRPDIIIETNPINAPFTDWGHALAEIREAVTNSVSCTSAEGRAGFRTPQIPGVNSPRFIGVYG